MPTITLPAKFFKNERDRAYSDWRSAFAREMTQNSIDAKCSKIEMTVEQRDDDTFVLFKDNGKGMTREVLEKVFFALGETTKTDGMLGGFGRARILTCFAMKSYIIRTGNIVCEGQGATYEIKETEDNVDGCIFEILIEKNDANPEDIIEATKRVLSQSQLYCDFYLNGEKYKTWLYRRTASAESSFGYIYVNKSQPGSAIVVRVQGLFMFNIYTTCKYQVIVEVDALNSRNILTSNRDAFNNKYRYDLDKFISDLTIDRKSLLSQKRSKTKLIRGAGVLVSRASTKTDPNLDVGRPLTLQGVAQAGDWTFHSVHLPPVEVKEQAQQSMVAAAVVSSAIPNVNAISTLMKNELEKTSINMDMWSIYIDDNSTDPKIRKEIDSYDPTNWVEAKVIKDGETLTYRKGGHKRKLLVAWKVCCEAAIDALRNFGITQRINWLVGWTFSDNDDEDKAGACHVNLNEGHALCLNPLNNQNKMLYSFRDPKDLKKLMALAKHEVSHILYSGHDEEFAGLLTKIDMEYDEYETMMKVKREIANLVES